MITVFYDFKKDKICLISQTQNDYELIRNTKELFNIGCCETQAGLFEVDKKYVYKLNTILTNNFANKIKVDKTFKEWVSKNIKQSPALIRCGAVYSKIYPGQIKIPHKDIEKATRYFFKPAVNMQKYKDGKWDGYINMYKRWLREFPTGLLNDVCEVLDKQKIPYTIEYAYDREPQRQFNWKVNDNLTPDPDQIEAINAAIEGKRGIVKAPTGFGKTAILAKRIVANLGVPTLFIANKKALLDDAADAFRDGVEGIKHCDVIQIKDGWFGETKLNSNTKEKDIKPITAPIVVATIQSLHARLKDERTKSYTQYWLNQVCKFVMVDECQATGTRMWDEVLSECNAPYRIFLSATPKRTDGSTIKIKAYSGPWLYSTTAEEQIEKGRLCDLDIKYQVYDHKLYNDNDADVNYMEMYRMCIVENDERNSECIVKPTMEMLKEGRHVLVLVQLIDHGTILQRMFMEAGLEPNDVRFIWGETPDKIRTEAIKEFKKGEFKVMIGSTIFDAGVNIPIISGVVLGGAGNSDITLIQRIGRGARNADYENVLGYLPEFMKKNHGEKITKVYDVMDVNTKFFHKQSRNRYYNAKNEFGENRVSIVGGDKSVLRKPTKHSRQAQKKVDQLSAQLDMLAEFSEK